MTEIYKGLNNKFGNKCKLRFFFTTENVYRKGNNHCHFTLYVSDSSLHDEVVGQLKSLINEDRLFLEKYDYYLAGTHYNLKEGAKGEDWDIYGTDLSCPEI